MSASYLVTEPRHMQVLGRQARRNMRRPPHESLVVDICPFRVVFCDFAFGGDFVHECLVSECVSESSAW